MLLSCGLNDNTVLMNCAVGTNKLWLQHKKQQFNHYRSPLKLLRLSHPPKDDK